MTVRCPINRTVVAKTFWRARAGECDPIELELAACANLITPAAA
jgi:hypothetical protein